LGTWSMPNTTEKAVHLERLMSEPISATTAMKRLYDILGDDTLFDMLTEAESNAPEVDVRPLIAGYIEFLSRWCPSADFTSHWEPGVRSRLEFLAARFADTEMNGVDTLIVPDDHTGQYAAIHLVHLMHPGETVQKQFRSERVGPGIYAIMDIEEDRIFRVECRYGLAHEAPEELKEVIRDGVFPVTAPKMN